MQIRTTVRLPRLNFPSWNVLSKPCHWNTEVLDHTSRVQYDAHVLCKRWLASSLWHLTPDEANNVWDVSNKRKRPNVFLFDCRTEIIAVLQLYNKRSLRVKYNVTTGDQVFLLVQFIHVVCLCDTKVFRKW
jgi:hypothetical protein